MADICIENLCKSFGDKKVIDNLNCIFESGRINCVMGKSGIGKTTLLNILMGIYEADSGTVSGISGKKRTSTWAALKIQTASRNWAKCRMRTRCPWGIPSPSCSG